jgi:hypothetical protein
LHDRNLQTVTGYGRQLATRSSHSGHRDFNGCFQCASDAQQFLTNKPAAIVGRVSDVAPGSQMFLAWLADTRSVRSSLFFA